MSPQKKRHRILVIEDQAGQADRIRSVFGRRGDEFVLTIVQSGRDAGAALNRERADALFFRQSDCAPDGAPFPAGISEDRLDETALILVADREEEAVSAIRAGVDECVVGGAASVDVYPAAALRVIARAEAERERTVQFGRIMQSQKQWMGVLDAITDYIFVIDEEHRLIKVNQSFADAFQMHPREIVGKKCHELFGADILSDCAASEVLHDGKPRTYEKNIGGEVYQIGVFPLHGDERNPTIHVMKNITELRRLKEQLHHADKLASIGLLVSGVAHEINNPLTGTIAYAELLGMRVADESVKRDLNKILESAERCKKIVDNLLTFSRQRTPAKSLESLNDIIDRAVELRSYWLRSGSIEVVKDYDPAATVYADTQQLQQVMLNLLLNAEQAIAAAGRGSGRIAFTTRLDRESRKIVVRVEDSGAGIDPGISSRIFDPFFTTKPVGVGTGLGLSISHGIVTEHGGTIRAENREGGGAAFIIELPTGTASLPGNRA